MGVHWVAQRDPRTLGKPSRGVVGRISAEQELPLILCLVINIVLVGAAGRQTTEPALPTGGKNTNTNFFARNAEEILWHQHCSTVPAPVRVTRENRVTWGRGRPDGQRWSATVPRQWTPPRSCGIAVLIAAHSTSHGLLG